MKPNAATLLGALIAFALAQVLSVGAAQAADNSEYARREAQYWIERRLLEHDMRVLAFETPVSVAPDQANNIPDSWTAVAEVSLIMPTGQKEEHEVQLDLVEWCPMVERPLCWWGGEVLLDGGAPLRSIQAEEEIKEFQRRLEKKNGTDQLQPLILAPPHEDGDETETSGPDEGDQKNKYARKSAKYWIERRLLESNAEGFELSSIEFTFIKKVKFPNRAQVKLLDSASVPGVWQVSALVLVDGPTISEKERRVTIKLMEACAELAEPRCWQAGPVWLDERKRPSEEYLGELRRIAEGQVPALSKFPNWALANALGTLRASRNHDFTRHAIREAELLMRRRLRERIAKEIEFIGPLTVELGEQGDDVWHAETLLWLTSGDGQRTRINASISVAWSNSCGGFNMPQCWFGLQIFLNDIRLPSLELDRERERREEENF